MQASDAEYCCIESCNIAYFVHKLSSNVNDTVEVSMLEDSLDFLLTCINIF